LGYSNTVVGSPNVVIGTDNMVGGSSSTVVGNGLSLEASGVSVAQIGPNFWTDLVNSLAARNYLGKNKYGVSVPYKNGSNYIDLVSKMNSFFGWDDLDLGRAFCGTGNNTFLSGTCSGRYQTTSKPGIGHNTEWVGTGWSFSKGGGTESIQEAWSKYPKFTVSVSACFFLCLGVGFSSTGKVFGSVGGGLVISSPSISISAGAPKSGCFGSNQLSIEYGWGALGASTTYLGPKSDYFENLAPIVQGQIDLKIKMKATAKLGGFGGGFAGMVTCTL
jgi:hypothetical protein